MDASTKKLADGFLDLFVEFMPYGSVTKKLMKLPLSFVLDLMAERSSARQAVDVLSQLANEIASDIAAVDSQYVENKGSAIAAAYDIIAIAKGVNMTPDLLVVCRLDATELYGRFMVAAAPTISGAGPERAGFIDDGLRKLADKVMTNADQLPGVNLAFMRAMLRGTNMVSITIPDDTQK
ncbi:MAG: hypothetical protein AB1704_20430 [Pseudomonadota bacterium]